MIIGVPRETHRHEHRVGLNPYAAARLLRQGHTVFVESHAGDAAHFSDKDYQDAGAQIVYSSDEAYQRADIVCRVGMITAPDLELVRPGSAICAFHHLPVMPRGMVEKLMELETTLLGYELIQNEHGEHPVRLPFGSMGGKMAIQVASHYLQASSGGRGVMMGNVPGVPPPTVLILGAGTVGRAAARTALASGVEVLVLDWDVRQLGMINRESGGQVVTVTPSATRLERYTAIADALIGAVHIPGERSPLMVTESMVRNMKPGSVIVDVAIDQGGCVETSRPTNPESPVFNMHDVLHYCVPNMTANVPRTASRVLANAALPYVVEMANHGLAQALGEDPGLAAGVYLYRGKMVNEKVGKSLGVPVVTLSDAVQEG